MNGIDWLVLYVACAVLFGAATHRKFIQVALEAPRGKHKPRAVLLAYLLAMAGWPVMTAAILGGSTGAIGGGK